jgi:hypothetical protein
MRANVFMALPQLTCESSLANFWILRNGVSGDSPIASLFPDKITGDFLPPVTNKKPGFFVAPHR